MILQRIELENYGPYKGVISLDLSITDNENVILVQGLNDTGKTSLYKAIQFAFMVNLMYFNIKNMLIELRGKLKME